MLMAEKDSKYKDKNIKQLTFLQVEFGSLAKTRIRVEVVLKG